MIDSTANSLEKPSDLGKTPDAIARRWKLELKLSHKREADWRERASDIYRQYTPENPAANSFNILWTNTETLRQAVYNSLPQPDARRRFQDEDELGRSVGEVLTRALEFAQDTYDFDSVLKGDVLSMLLAGRAVSRVLYVPDINELGDKTQEPEAYEEIAWEQVICERVQYDDFRILGAAKTWDEVQAVAFRHRLTRDNCIEKFGDDVGNKITLNNSEDEDVKNSKAETQDLFKTAEVWEIWCKEDKEVLFITESLPMPCKTQDDPMKLQGFFPVPRPLYAIENDSTLVPAALFTQYEQQAKELNRISIRINKLIEALKVRGIYDSMLGELGQLMKAADNELIASANVTALLERGGLEKAIWMMPIDTAAAVIKELYIQRDSCKQIIYEITGIADIMRSASDPNETFGAQKIKTQWGTQRLQRLQREVQRYIRDLIRLKAEVISEKFQPETLEAMTLIKMPHQAELDQAYQQQLMQWQQQAMMPPQPGQPPPQQPQPDTQTVTWEKVIEAMRSDATRTYRIDIETDSTLSATQDNDMAALKDVLTGLSQIMQGFGPAVQQGAMDVGMLKELMLVVCRRAKMGTSVEDVISKIKQPPPLPPEADPTAGQLQIEQVKMQGQGQIEQMKAQLADQQHQREMQANMQAAKQKAELDAQLQAHEQQVQAQQNEHQNMLEAQRAEQKANYDAQMESARMAESARAAQAKQQSDDAKLALEAERLNFEREKLGYTANLEKLKLEMELHKAKIQVEGSIAVAQVNGDISLKTAAIGGDKPAAEVADSPDPMNRMLETVDASMMALMQGQQEIAQHLSRPKTVLRDAEGRISGVS